MTLETRLSLAGERFLHLAGAGLERASLLACFDRHRALAARGARLFRRRGLHRTFDLRSFCFNCFNMFLLD